MTKRPKGRPEGASPLGGERATRASGGSNRFRVGITRDILDSRGEPSFGRKALEILDRPGTIDWEYLPTVVREITPDLAGRYDAIYVNMARTPASAVARGDCRLRVVARHGVGYDSVNVGDDAGRRSDHQYPGGDTRPVATIALTFVLRSPAN
jgi:phosphoglycerate dehydrogenase-like enzyme